MRRQPVYFVIDLTMPAAVRTRILNCALRAWRCDPQALETLCLSMVCYGEAATHVVPLANLIEIEPNRFVVSTTYTQSRAADLGKGLVVLMNAVQSEVKKGNSYSKGDFHSVVFVLCHSEPTDRWRAYLNELRASNIRSIMVLAPESVIRRSGLRELTDCVLPVELADDARLDEFFRIPFVVWDGPIEEC